uniref:OPR8 n=1 Tax=Arundo donax TaxID=35708 RepID=A0A0A9HL12_ARUDO
MHQSALDCISQGREEILGRRTRRWCPRRLAARPPWTAARSTPPARAPVPRRAPCTSSSAPAPAGARGGSGASGTARRATGAATGPAAASDPSRRRSSGWRGGGEG